MTLLLFAPIFPWDHANESALGHHHLVAAYCFVWALQLAYLASIGWKWRRLAKTGREESSS